MDKTFLNQILITGGNGMVGSQIPFGYKPLRRAMDITDAKNVDSVLRSFKPSAVIHLAAMTDMVQCEKEPEKAYRINMLGTYNLAAACKKYGIYFIYLSTCAVFDGSKKSPYVEKDIPNSLNVYGHTKLLGEIVVRDIIPNHLIIRTGWLFGGAKDKKFVKKSFDLLQQGKIITATNDRIGSPTYTPDLVKQIVTLIKKRSRGIFHVINGGKASYYEIALKIKKNGKFIPKIKPVSFKTIEPSLLKRGKNESLTSSYIRLRPWKSALRDYIKELRK